jgi:hypothetical protein
MRTLPAAIALSTVLASSLIVTAAETTMLAELPDPSLIDSSIDGSALDEMLRGKERRVLRWTHAPRLVVLMSVMAYAESGAVHVATDETMSDAEAADLEKDLTDALALLSGGAHARFADVHREVVAAGAPARAPNRGDIVVGRYRGVRDRLKTLGLGGRRWTGDGRITSGAILLDDDYDRTSDVRHLLRAHELGHALGYNHVSSRASIMNPRIGSEPTEFDRQAARIAFSHLIAR